MRGFIRFCARLFVIAGMLTMLASIVLGVLIFAGGAVTGAQQADAAIGATAALAAGGSGLLIVIGGIATGATITLIGGATFLLAEIDARLERLPKLYAGTFNGPKLEG